MTRLDFSKKQQLLFISITTLVQFLFIFVLLYMSGVLSANALLAFYFTSLLINTGFLCKLTYQRIISVIALLVVAIQLLAYITIGDYLVTEILLNIQFFKEIGSENVRKLLCFLLLFLTLWFPNIYFPQLEKSKKSIALSVAIIVLLFLCPPIYSIYRPLADAYELLTSKTVFDVNLAEEFKRNTIPNGPIPFSAKGCNVLVIFAEGTSAEIISPEITPNTYQLKQKSFSVENYFCHTAPTFRGIRGQLISGYQLHGTDISERILNNPKLVNTPSLQTILKNLGYKTCFVTPDPLGDDFDNMISNIGFDKVVRGNNNPEILPDKETYEILFKTVDGYYEKNEKFLICTYIEGTHAERDSPHKKYGDGTVACLNKFYNQDYWFGEFMNKMESKGYLNDTLLVFTADHSSFPSVDFVKAFKPKNTFFIGKVPLYFYRTGITPQVFDAENRNSLSLTPTILNILEETDHPNFFLGNSLFVKDKTPYERLSVRQSEFVNTESGKGKLILAPAKDLTDKITRFYNIFG